MNLNDHGFIPDIDPTPTKRTRLSRLILPLVLVVFLVTGFAALHALSHDAGPNKFNALTRVLQKDQVGWAGIAWDGVPPSQTSAMGVPYALKVTVVAPNGPADKAGLAKGDYIVGLNGKPFSGAFELQGKVRRFLPGQTITLNVVRAGKSLAISITLASWAEIEQLEIKTIAL